MKERIDTLDELRALAIGAVMLSHFALAFGSQSIVAFWLNLPDLSVGVDLFFVISGFLIFQNLADLTETASDFHASCRGLLCAPADPDRASGMGDPRSDRAGRS